MARKLIDDGVIGEPVGAFANLHAFAAPRPPAVRRMATRAYMTDFFEYGGSWAFDRGPYYLYALINLLGPVKRVTGRITWPERERGGELRKVNAPSHVADCWTLAMARCASSDDRRRLADRSAAHRDL